MGGFGEGVLGDVSVVGPGGDLVEALVASRDQCGLLGDVGGVESGFGEIAGGLEGLESLVVDELGEHRIAPEMGLGGGVEVFGVEVTDDEAEVKVAVENRGDFAATNPAGIAFVAVHLRGCEIQGRGGG